MPVRSECTGRHHDDAHRPRRAAARSRAGARGAHSALAPRRPPARRHHRAPPVDDGLPRGAPPIRGQRPLPCRARTRRCCRGAARRHGHRSRGRHRCRHEPRDCDQQLCAARRKRSSAKPSSQPSRTCPRSWSRTCGARRVRRCRWCRATSRTRSGAPSSRTHNLDGKSKAQLGREGHWLIDDADADDRARVLGLVPLVPRLVLLYGFGPSYRRRTRACWHPRRHRVHHHGATDVVVDAGIDAVWDVVRDPTRVGEWSHECVDGEWVGRTTEARPGARFRGRNKQGLFRWGRLCEVISAEPYELVWRTVPTRLYPRQHRMGAPPRTGGRRHEDRAELPDREGDRARAPLRDDPAGASRSDGRVATGPRADRQAGDRRIEIRGSGAPGLDSAQGVGQAVTTRR